MMHCACPLHSCRPSFIAILDELKRLRARLCGAAGGASTCRTGDGSSATAASRGGGRGGAGARGGPLELTLSPPPAFAHWTFPANASQVSAWGSRRQGAAVRGGCLVAARAAAIQHACPGSLIPTVEGNRRVLLGRATSSTALCN